MTWRTRTQQVFSKLQQGQKLSIRAIAKALSISKSSVHRQQQSIQRRNRYPESPLWESPEGEQWLRRLVWALVYVFGLQRGIGDETLSTFLHMVHLEQHIGVSPTAMRSIRTKMEQQVLNYQRQRQQELEETEIKVQVCGGADETFFEQMVLVFMDLASGYIFVESQTAQRNYDTWHEQVQDTLSAYIQVKYLVSDRAKALVKLALTGLGCRSIPDLFHALRDLNRAAGGPLARQLSRLRQKLDQLHQRLEHRQSKATDKSTQAELQQLKAQYTALASTQQTYEQLRQQLSLSVHPFAIDGSGFHSANEVLTTLKETLQSLSALSEPAELPKLPAAVEQFSAQAKEIACVVNAWWSWVIESLTTHSLPPEMSNWVLGCLLPMFYWQQQQDKTSNPDLKSAYRQAYEHAQATYACDPITLRLSPQVLQQWRSWAQWMVSKFQRTSSPVEGRNGYLNQIHHGLRGLSQRRLQVLTCIHNFSLKRDDGSTAAERLFGHPFPDLFEYLVENMRELPMPRKARKAKRPQITTLPAVPA